MKKSLLLLIFIIVSSFSTCGKKGDPLPPRIFEPTPPSKINYQQIVLKPLIYWNPPSKFIDGEPISENETKLLIYLIDINFGKKLAKTDKTFYLDNRKQTGEKVCYRVAAIYKNEKGEFSEPICFKIQKPIKERPEIENKIAMDRTVKVLFKKPHFPIEVFKTEKGKPFSIIKPYTTISENIFIDKNVENGRTYIYRFRYTNGKLKGEYTKPISLTPEDNIPPAPPQNPVLITINNSECLIVWEPSPSIDTIYYTILLDKKEIGKTENLYFQTPCKKGIFKVVAVDKSGNRSKPETVKRR